MQLAQQPRFHHTQTMRMSVQMIKSLDILTLPTVELRQRITQEIESNPALERADEYSDVSLEEAFEEFDIVEYDNAESEWADTTAVAHAKDLGAIIEHTSTTFERQNLRDTLYAQLRLQKMSQKEYQYGEILINNLDDDGFHIIDPYQHPKLLEYGDVAALIVRIQTFEPWGICVYNVQESLILQAILRGNAPPDTIRVLQNHFVQLEKKKINEIAHALRLPRESVMEIYAYIRGLTPYPGRAVSARRAEYIVPDLEILFDNNIYHVFVNEDAYPKLRINKLFLTIKAEEKTHDNAFVKSYVRDARGFMGALQKRNHTLLRTAYVLLHRQHRFFRLGPQYIRPLKLQDVAQALKLHESTVSRIASKKYVQTNWGIFSLSDLFSSKVASNNAHHSKASVKSIIQQIVTRDDGHLPDQKIVDRLRERGINLARRTVTKYRHELDIPKTSDRERAART